jgi:hypothetical protein
MGTLSFRQPIADKLTDISEYLNQWFGALPFEALNTIFGVELNGLSQEGTEEELTDLKTEWDAYSLQAQAEIHDTFFDKYYEFTKHIELLNGEVYL